jgi:hypothetical protein
MNGVPSDSVKHVHIRGVRSEDLFVKKIELSINGLSWHSMTGLEMS